MTDKADKADTSLARMLSVLDLFSDQRLHWSAEDISESLGVSLPTSYRYLKTLSDAGLLRRGSDAQFTLGSRIVVLDHLQQTDGTVIGALSLVTTVQRMAVIDQTKLTPLIQRAAREISARLH
jgi:DNA-binding IclR family transcriptional regulator